MAKSQHLKCPCRMNQVESKLSKHEDVNGNEAKEHVFAQIDAALTHVGEQRKVNSGSVAA
ncbi:hypothetical protein Gotur_014923 [Gossypium turneri]